MPLRRFWLLSGMIQRIEAQRDLRLLTVILAARAKPEDRKDYEAKLTEQIGTIAVIYDTLDREGLERLRQLQG
ncbi:hypothetical protein [Methylocaldum szegediense]|uniref:hypothetical protein n=1 Tax=Methylocaldum szegediense TaxID=73780 RepID=UPI0012EC17AD|nr:hypothetical protein [Methylocaldum szegediense]